MNRADDNKKFKHLNTFVDLHKMGRVWRQAMIPSKPMLEGTVLEVHDYTDRFAIKDLDPTEHRFCSDTRVSKEYETVLKSHCSRILPDVNDYLWDTEVPKSKAKQ